MKFIIVERQCNKDTVQLHVVTFDITVVHSEMFKSFRRLLVNHFGHSEIKCVSAGFYLPGKMCYGQSDSLGINTHIRSFEVIQMIDYFSIFHKDESLLKS